MGISWSDAAADAYDSDRGDAALAEVVSAAEEIAARCTQEWASNSLAPDVSVDLDIGGDDQPLFVFAVNVELADDLDSSEYPLDEIQELASALRGRVSGSMVAGWSWLVTVGTKASAAHP